MTLQRDDGAGGSGQPWSPPWVGDRFLARGWSGASFDHGLLRFHDSDSAAAASELVGETFGQIVGNVGLFAFDWLGRHYGVIDPALGDPARGDRPEPDVVTFDLGIGEVRLVATLDEVTHDIDNGSITEFLEAEAFDAWRDSAGGALAFDECAGYIHPPFLGGPESLDNLERSNLSVYWHVVGSLYRRTADLPDGAPVTEVTLRDA